MSKVTALLKPAVIWKHFETLASIPRRSREEDKVLAYLKSFADERGLDWTQDDAGNMVIRRPGTSGGQGAPTVVIQGHVDMVCEKEPEHEHDFSTDSIQLDIQDDWLTAKGTTLGADNGLGVAAGLALLEMPSDATLPPIEGLFTVAEEIGLVGAKALDGDMVKGRILLNLDAEDWPNIYVGCAGGGITNVSLPSAPESLDGAGWVGGVLTVNGLVGGHSGADIHLYRASAIKLAARLLSPLVEEDLCRIVDLRAGDKQHNVIPRTSRAEIVVRRGAETRASAAFEEAKRVLTLEYGTSEREMALDLVLSSPQKAAAGSALSAGDGRRAIALLTNLPYGPIKFSHSIPGMVETSNNLASVKIEDGSLRVMCSTRSSVNGAIEAVRSQIRALASLCGASVTGNKPYPGWQPNLDSKIVKRTVAEVTELIGREPKVTAIHAGLECGIIGERLGGDCDMVAFGPTITGAHTPGERVQISTVEPFWNLVLNVVRAVATNKGEE